jgi:hypothetical protein
MPDLLYFPMQIAMQIRFGDFLEQAGEATSNFPGIYRDLLIETVGVVS